MRNKIFFNNFKSRLFPIQKSDKIPAYEQRPKLALEPTKYKKSKLKLQQEYMNEIIAGGKNINDKVFWNYVKYPLFSAKYLIRSTEAKNEQLVNNITDGLIFLIYAIIKKDISENKNSNKTVDIVEKSLTLRSNKSLKELKYQL